MKIYRFLIHCDGNNVVSVIESMSEKDAWIEIRSLYPDCDIKIELLH